MALSVLVAASPIIFIFRALIIRKMKGYQASLIAIGIAAVVAIGLYGMPVRLAILSIETKEKSVNYLPVIWLYFNNLTLVRM